MKILIITAFFPPQNSIASLRPYTWAKYWARGGHRVTVLTPPKGEALSGLALPLSGFTTLEVPIPGWARLRSSFGLSSGGAACNAQSGSATVKHGLKLRLRQLLANWQRRTGVALSCRMPDPMDLWTAPAYRAVSGSRWDLVVSTAGPYCVHRPAYELKRQGLAGKWIADWRDLWSDNHIYPGLWGLRGFEKWLERRWCAQADILTTVSEPLAETLRRNHGDKVVVVPNGFDPEDYPSQSSEASFPNDGCVRILYTGSLYPGSQDPSPLFKAIRDVRDSHGVGPDRLKVLFCGNRANADDLAALEGVADFVEYLGLVPRNEALRMQRDANALLFLEFDHAGARGVVTGKIFEYLRAGPPILSIGTGHDSGVEGLLERTGCGLTCGTDTHRIKAFLLGLLNGDPWRVSRNQAEIDAYDRRRLAEAMLDLAGTPAGTSDG